MRRQMRGSSDQPRDTTDARGVHRNDMRSGKFDKAAVEDQMVRARWCGQFLSLPLRDIRRSRQNHSEDAIQKRCIIETVDDQGCGLLSRAVKFTSIKL